MRRKFCIFAAKSKNKEFQPFAVTMNPNCSHNSRTLRKTVVIHLEIILERVERKDYVSLRSASTKSYWLLQTHWYPVRNCAPNAESLYSTLRITKYVNQQPIPQLAGEDSVSDERPLDEGTLPTTLSSPEKEASFVEVHSALVNIEKPLRSYISFHQLRKKWWARKSWSVLQNR